MYSSLTALLSGSFSHLLFALLLRAWAFLHCSLNHGLENLSFILSLDFLNISLLDSYMSSVKYSTLFSMSSSALAGLLNKFVLQAFQLFSSMIHFLLFPLVILSGSIAILT